MRRVKLIWVGKSGRRDPESELCTRYLTRLKAFVQLEEQIIKPLQNGPTPQIQQRESERILSALDDRDQLILCDERGRQLTSPGLAEFLGHPDRGGARLVFVIGGAMGVSDPLRARANFVLSLSKMTLPHALARVLLLEQIYRAYCIQEGRAYHHEG